MNQIKRLFDSIESPVPDNVISIRVPPWMRYAVTVFLTTLGVEGGHRTWSTFITTGPERLVTVENILREFQDSATAQRARRASEKATTNETILEILCDISPSHC